MPEINENKKESKEENIKEVKKGKVFLLLLCIVLLGVYIDIADHSALSANFADSVLRPLLGNERTLLLESFFFNGTDLFNQLQYKLITPKDPFSGGLGNIVIKKNTQNSDMDLTSISLYNYKEALLPGEGVWQTLILNHATHQPIMAKTFMRPDRQRPYAIVSLVKINMKRLFLSAVAGTKEPGGLEGHPGPGKIPLNIQNSNKLVAAFNGGFQEKDGHYGMIVANQTYLPLKTGLATLIIDKDSNIKIVYYHGQDLGKGNIAVRQNGDMLLENSVVIPSLRDNQYNVWGRTVTNSMYTWRSGIGITKNGNLLYAAGPSLIPETLAEALHSAGAVNAMQLDINPYWVRFVAFNPLGNGKYQHSSLQKNMYDGGQQFLSGYQKDFFYIYER